MKRLKQILLVLLVVLMLIQFIQPAQNKGSQYTSAELTQTINVPENVQIIFQRACYDCHSNNTNYPWYSRIQPFGWLLAKHIKEGKAELNFSEFGSYSLRRQISKLKGIENSIKNGGMPLKSYEFIHSSARLTEQDKSLIIEWSEKTRDSLSAKR